MEVRRLPSWVKTPYDMELYHSGIIGMKHGRRRYQNKDGSLTPLGRIHYGVGQARTVASRVGEETSQAKDRISGEISSSRIGASGTRASNLGESGSGLTRRANYKGKDYIDVSSYNSYEHRRTRETRYVHDLKEGRKLVDRTIATHMDETIDFTIHKATDAKKFLWAEEQLGMKTPYGEKLKQRARTESMQDLMDTRLDDLREMEMQRYSGEGYTSSGSPGKRRDYSYSTSGIRNSAGRKNYTPLRGKDKRW